VVYILSKILLKYPTNISPVTPSNSFQKYYPDISPVTPPQILSRNTAQILH
jgi:hypothetical protein